MSDLELDELRFVSVNPVHPIRPPLRASRLLSCMAIEIYETTLLERIGITDIVLNGMPSKYYVESMTHICDSRYVMNTYDRNDEKHTTYDTDIMTSNIACIGEHDYYPYTINS